LAEEPCHFRLFVHAARVQPWARRASGQQYRAIATGVSDSHNVLIFAPPTNRQLVAVSRQRRSSRIVFALPSREQVYLPLARLLSTDIEGPSHFITGQCPIELLRGRDLPVNCAAGGTPPTRAYTSQVLSILILSLRDDDCQFRHSIGQSPRWSSTVGYFPTSGVHGGGRVPC
jgi:hypothetical protein